MSEASEDVFLVSLETRWVRARNELHNDCPFNLVPSSFPAWLKIRPQSSRSLLLSTLSQNRQSWSKVSLSTFSNFRPKVFFKGKNFFSLAHTTVCLYLSILRFKLNPPFPFWKIVFLRKNIEEAFSLSVKAVFLNLFVSKSRSMTNFWVTVPVQESFRLLSRNVSPKHKECTFWDRFFFIWYTFFIMFSNWSLIQ